MNSNFTDITAEQLDTLILRVKQAQEHQFALSPEDCELLLTALMTLASMQERLSDNSITLNKLRKLAGIVKSSESLSSVVAVHSKVTPKKTIKKSNNKSRAAPPVKPRVETHSLEGMKKGDTCSECQVGKLYKFEPATFLRIIGHSPYTPVQHVMERLRCNACGAYFTAEVSKEVLEDGEPGYKYGYSARALMAVGKYYAGTPFYR